MCQGFVRWRGSWYHFHGASAMRTEIFSCPLSVVLPKGSEPHHRLSGWKKLPVEVKPLSHDMNVPHLLSEDACNFLYEPFSRSVSPLLKTWHLTSFNLAPTVLWSLVPLYSFLLFNFFWCGPHLSIPRALSTVWKNHDRFLCVSLIAFSKDL